MARPDPARARRRSALVASAGAGQRQAPAHGEASAQQDHRGRRPEGAGGRLRLDQLHLARLLRAVQQRHGAAGQERGEAVPCGVRRLLGERRRRRLRRHGLREVDRSRPDRASTRRSRSRRTRRRTRCWRRSPTTSRRRRRRACSIRWRSSSRRRGRFTTRSRRSRKTTTSSSTASPTRRSAASTCRSPTAMSRRCIAAALAKNVPEPFTERADGRRRHPHAPQVRRHRLRQADRARLPRLLQLLRSPADTKNGENLLLIRDRRDRRRPT